MKQSADTALDLTASDAAGQKKLNQYLALAREVHYPLILVLLRKYVDSSIPNAYLTVGDEWGVTAMPSTNRSRTHQRLTAISLPRSPEAFVIYRIREEADDPWITEGFVHVDRAALLQVNDVENMAALRRIYPAFEFEKAVYHDFQDAVRIRFVLDEIADGPQRQLFEITGWHDAAGALAAQLLGSHSIQARYTNPFLASSVLG